MLEIKKDLLKEDKGKIIKNYNKIFLIQINRLIGPKGMTLKALELLTQCYILVQGSTVCVMGYFKQLKTIRKIIEDCMNNVHPIYHIKELMIKRELMKRPELANENWDRFLPQFKKRNVKRKKTPKRVEKVYNPFPPEQKPRKIDEKLETGEYFMGEADKKDKKKKKNKTKNEEIIEEKENKKIERVKERKEKKTEKENKFIAPDENIIKAVNQRISEPSLDQLKEKFLSKKRKNKDD